MFLATRAPIIFLDPEMSLRLESAQFDQEKRNIRPCFEGVHCLRIGACVLPLSRD